MGRPRPHGRIIGRHKAISCSMKRNEPYVSMGGHAALRRVTTLTHQVLAFELVVRAWG